MSGRSTRRLEPRPLCTLCPGLGGRVYRQAMNSFSRRPLVRRYALVAALTLFVVVVLVFRGKEDAQLVQDQPAESTSVTTTTTPKPVYAHTKKPLPTARRPYDFNGFDNVTGLQTGDFLVPNIVHFLRFGKDKAEIGFVDFIVILAAYKNQRPDRILFHTDAGNFTGGYWEKLMTAPGFADTMELVPSQLPTHIFGQEFNSSYKVWHSADVLRVQILMKYGGIILDTDSYVVRSFDEFRRFELTMGWDDKQYMGVQVVIAHPDARFLNLWLETYRGAYKSNLWYYNAGERPTTEVLFKHPELMHRVKLLFGVHYLIHKLYKEKEVWPEWRDQYSIHLLIRHQAKAFTEENFMSPPTTFREMVLDVYDPYTKMPRVV